MTDYYDPYDIHNYAGPQNLNNNDNDDNNLGIKKKMYLIHMKIIIKMMKILL